MTTHYSEWYEVRGTANLRKNPEIEVTLSIGEIRGMSDNGQPGWTEYSGTRFQTPEEGLNLSSYLSSHWDHINLRDIRVIKRTRTTMVIDTEENVTD